MSEIPRPFAKEYQAATGQPVRTLWIDPFRQMIGREYVEWLEGELMKARKANGNLEA